MIVTDRVEKYVPPKKGRRHVLRVIGEILAFQPTSRRTNLAVGLEFLAKVARRRSVVFLASDFMSEGWERPLRICAQRHELVPVVVGDPLEAWIPPVGLLALEDLETGEVVELDTSGAPATRCGARARRRRARGIGAASARTSTSSRCAPTAVRRRADRVLSRARERMAHG